MGGPERLLEPDTQVDVHAQRMVPVIDVECAGDLIHRDVCAQSRLRVVESAEVARVSDGVSADVEPSRARLRKKLFFQRGVSGEQLIALRPLVPAGDEILVTEGDYGFRED